MALRLVVRKEKMINRSAIVVRAKQPFLNWLLDLPDPVSTDITLDEINNEPHIYLLPEYETIDQQDELLSGFYDIVFDAELNGWWTDETNWPAHRDFNLFKDWFSVEFHSIIEDIVDEPLINEY